jgi:hypothetical protein
VPHAHSNTATHQHSSTATHAHYQHTAAHGNQRATHTDIQTHSAAATHTTHTTLQTQHARQHSSNTLCCVHPPTTASNSVQRSHSHTQCFRYGATVAVCSHTTAARHRDCDMHNGMSASWRVSPETTHTNKPCTAHRTLTHSKQKQAPHARGTSRTAPTTAHCAIITARTPPHARHTQHGTQLRAPHTPPTENHTQSHTRPPHNTHTRAVRLPSVDGMLPESWLLYKINCLQDTRTAIASHHCTRHRRRPQPAARSASQCIA